MKYAVLTALVLLSLGQIWAGPIVFGDVNSQIAADFLKMVRDAAARDEIFSWEDTDVYSVIQITEQGPIDLREGKQILVTVSLGFSEDDDKPQTFSFGTFYMYAPLQTKALWLDESRKQQSLSEAMSLLDDAAEMITPKFFDIYRSGHRESYTAMLQAELNTYSAMALQWYKTPVSQGGAGQKLTATSMSDLAAFLGYGPDLCSWDNPNGVYSIVDIRDGVITLGAYMFWEDELPLYFAKIRLATSQVTLSRNPAYSED